MFTWVSVLCFGFSRDELDQYNEKTIALLDDLDSCMLRVEYAVEQAEEINYPYGMAYALYLKSYILHEQNDLGKAFLTNLKALNILSDLQDERSSDTQVRLYLESGEILEKHFKYEDAIRYYKRGLEIAEQHDFSRLIMRTSYSLGLSYYLMEDWNNARKFINKSFILAEDLKHEAVAADALNLMGLVFKSSGQPDSAKHFYQKMLEDRYDDAYNRSKYKGRAYHNLANLYAQTGNNASALLAFAKALEYKMATQDMSQVFITEKDLAELHYTLGEYEKASEMIRSCMTKYQNMWIDPEHYAVFDLARKIAAASQNHELTKYYTNRYVEENEKFLERQAELIEMRDQFKMEILEASFASEQERNMRISNLHKVIVSLLVLSLVVVSYVKLKQVWVKHQLARELDQLVKE